MVAGGGRGFGKLRCYESEGYRVGRCWRGRARFSGWLGMDSVTSSGAESNGCAAHLDGDDPLVLLLEELRQKHPAIRRHWRKWAGV